ncbi:galaxin-2-like [Orbicella faveolata]|uniref:galaxin-2-like n=1 Tax=Orbicella faveolata TaxID=48498 RepID=UPI0009E1FE05|nr:galaxin-2-like [Orbicella faveolata]
MAQFSRILAATVLLMFVVETYCWSCGGVEYRCCGKNSYTPSTHVCCSGSVFRKPSQCCGSKPYYPSYQDCCYERVGIVVRNKGRCKESDKDGNIY